MGRKLSLTSFWLSLCILPGVPLLGALLGVVAVIKGRNDPDSQTDVAFAAIPMGIILGIFTLALLLGALQGEGLIVL